MKLKLDLSTIIRDWWMIAYVGTPGQIGPTHFSSRGGEYDGNAVAQANHNIVEARIASYAKRNGLHASSLLRAHMKAVAAGSVMHEFGHGIVDWGTFASEVLGDARQSYKSLQT